MGCTRRRTRRRTEFGPTTKKQHAAMSGGGLRKVLDKIQRTVQDGNYYDAHQMYHSASQRFVKQKKTDEATELLQSGIRCMVSHDQIGSAIDLAERMLDIMETNSPVVTDEVQSRLIDVFYAFPLESSGCDQFTRICIKWTAKHSEHSFGDPHLHHVFGSRYYKEQKYYDAEMHFVYGTIDSAKALAHMALEIAELGQASDPGYFACRAVLQLLAINKFDEAKTTLTTFSTAYKQSHPDTVKQTVRLGSEDFAVTSSAYLNIAQLAIECVERNAGDLFSNLLIAMRPILSSDEFMLHVAELVAAFYWNVGPRQKQINPFAEMVKNMFAGPSSGQQSALPSSIKLPAISSADMD